MIRTGPGVLAWAFALVLALAGPLAAQDELDPNNRDGDHGGFTLAPELDFGGAGDDGSFTLVEDVEQETVALAAGAVLRGLDTISGEVTDIDVITGQRIDYGRLSITMTECRYPKDNPSGDAYVYLVIEPQGDDRPMFQGWMVASSPALNALDHPRYDIWVLRCNTS